MPEPPGYAEACRRPAMSVLEASYADPSCFVLTRFSLHLPLPAMLFLPMTACETRHLKLKSGSNGAAKWLSSCSCWMLVLAAGPVSTLS